METTHTFLNYLSQAVSLEKVDEMNENPAPPFKVPSFKHHLLRVEDRFVKTRVVRQQRKALRISLLDSISKVYSGMY